ncbi:hypothetical protein CVT26_008628 [Gymnopilus dilepis]|uniref:Hydrophobin n=1 Tax=Gymnopilus dilepis TaxID=231916 RepID=A0A409XXV9_9AGAR|nr:hypothetical protein CVT26_008628 [Gymnopilus dilepis]
MQSFNKLFVTLVVLVGSAIAVPAVPNPDVATTVDVCNGPGSLCLEVAFTPDDCVDFLGALSVFSQNVGRVQIPGGFICSFNRQFSCTDAEPVLVASANFQTLGTEDINSFVCSLQPV